MKNLYKEMKKKRKIFESLRFNVFSFVYNVFLKFATPLESGEPFFFCLYFNIINTQKLMYKSHNPPKKLIFLGGGGCTMELYIIK